MKGTGAICPWIGRSCFNYGTTHCTDSCNWSKTDNNVE